MKKRKKYFGFLVVPLIKFIFYVVTHEKTRYGKVLVSILGENVWNEKQKGICGDCFDLLKNVLPQKNISTVYSNINRIYIGASIASSIDYILTPCKMLIIFHKEGYTDNPRYLASLLVRCACEMENFQLDKPKRKKMGRIAQLECLSNFSGEDIDFFKERLTNLINTESASPSPQNFKG